jgi:hypothetical protein
MVASASPTRYAARLPHAAFEVVEGIVSLSAPDAGDGVVTLDGSR